MSISEFARKEQEIEPICTSPNLSSPPAGLATWIVEAVDADYVVDAHTAYEAAKLCCASFARPTRVIMVRDHGEQECQKLEEQELKDTRNSKTESEKPLESLTGSPVSTTNQESPFTSHLQELDAQNVEVLRTLLQSGMDSEKVEVTLSVLSRHMTAEEYLSLWK